jgi:hypothetical protein
MSDRWNLMKTMTNSANRVQGDTRAAKGGRRLRELILPMALTALSLAGCYRYTPIEFHEAPATKNVRAYLSIEGISEVERIFRSRQHHLDGRVEWIDSARIVLRVQGSNHPGSTRGAVLQQRVELSKNQVRFLELIELDRTKTYAVTAAAITGTVTILVLRFSRRTGGTITPPRNGPDV